MSRTVITVTTNEDEKKYQIAFDEKALEKLGSEITETIMCGLRLYMDSYLDLLKDKARFKQAKRHWKEVKEGRKAALTVDEFDSDIPF